MAEVDGIAETVRKAEAFSRRIVARTADVRTFGALSVALNEGVAEFGGLDIFCANAGIGGYGRPEELTEQTWQDRLDINLTGVWHTVKCALPRLETRGGGSVTLTSSTAGVRGIEDIAHCSAAKHGVIGLGKTLALEWAGRGIRVNSFV